MQTLSPLLRNRHHQVDHIEISALKVRDDAPRSHPKSQIRALKKSLQAFDQVLPVLIDEHNFIISGAAVWEALKQLGCTHVMVLRIEHLSPSQTQALMIALNRLSDLSKWDDQKLNALLLDLSSVNLDFEIEATGFTEIEIELRVEEPSPSPQDEEASILVASGPAVTSLGELWHLGEHRLFCGTALNASSWLTAMGEDRAHAVITDPPYNIPIDGFVSGLGKHRHREFAMAVGELSPAEFENFLSKAMRHAYEYSQPGSLHYWAMDWRHVGEISAAASKVYDRNVNLAVWAKSQPGMGSLYRSQYELFFIYGRGGAPYRNNVQLGRFGRSRSNVWSYPGAASLAKTAEEGNPLSFHPTVKPLALVADILLDCTRKGDMVADPFGGSGTTMIACEKLGRRARLIELDPAYCDLIIRRWQHWTGEAATRAGDGLTFDQVGAMSSASASQVTR